jgi:uncharacterized protein (DUF1778 family)
MKTREGFVSNSSSSSFVLISKPENAQKLLKDERKRKLKRIFQRDVVSIHDEIFKNNK